MSQFAKIWGAILLLVALAGGTLIVFQSNKIKKLDETLRVLKRQVTEIAVAKPTTETLPMPFTEDRKNWREVQRDLRDAVVQIFSEIADFNWLEPYKSPNQFQSTGSGFFINEAGDIITNAHVVDQAKGVSIQIPSFGKRRFDVTVYGVTPERDLALLKMDPKDVKEIKTALGKIPVLPIGDSDSVHRSEELMALGYPLGQQSLKSTTGIVSGREHIVGKHMIQISAPINPGSSGGPVINCEGQVIGVSTAAIPGAQNVGYITPSNDVRLFRHHLEQMPGVKGEAKFLRKPFLGILFNPASSYLTTYLNNPQPGGLYVAGTQKNSPLQKIGVKPGDMIYEIDGYPIDVHGEMNVPWSEDKISVVDYISRLMIGDQVNLLVYRKGKEHTFSLTFSESELAPVRRMYPGYEHIDYEIIGGLVIMPLSLNHLPLLVQAAPELTQYMEIQNQIEGTLIITHVFPTSAASRSRTLGAGSVVREVNGEAVKTLDDLRRILRKSFDTGFLTVKTHQNVFSVLPFERVLQDEPRLARTFVYPVSDLVKEYYAQKALTENLTEKPSRARRQHSSVPEEKGRSLFQSWWRTNPFQSSTTQKEAKKSELSQEVQGNDKGTTASSKPVTNKTSPDDGSDSQASVEEDESKKTT